MSNDEFNIKDERRLPVQIWEEGIDRIPSIGLAAFALYCYIARGDRLDDDQMAAALGMSESLIHRCVYRLVEADLIEISRDRDGDEDVTTYNLVDPRYAEKQVA